MLGDPKLRIIYFSLEMASELLFAKLLAIHILDTYKVKIEYKEILSLGCELSEEKYKLVLTAKEWLKKAEKHLIIYDKPVNADGVFEYLMNYLKANGKFVKISETQTAYEPKVKDPYNIVVVDHIRLLTGKPKEEIDKLCDMLVYLRNIAGLTEVLIQQINRDSQSMDRRKGGYNLIQLSDLADSSSPAQSAETVLAVFHPAREQLASCCGYNIEQLGDYGRIFQCIKNRYGNSDKSIGMAFYGSVGTFAELPKPKGIRNYDIYKDIKYYLGEVKEEDIKTEDKPIFSMMGS